MYLWLLAPSKAKSNWSLPEDAALINTLGGKTEGLHSHLLGIYRFAPSMPRVEQQRTYKIAHGGNGQHRRTSRSYHQKLHQGTGDASFWLFVRPAAHGHGGMHGQRRLSLRPWQWRQESQRRNLQRLPAAIPHAGSNSSTTLVSTADVGLVLITTSLHPWFPIWFRFLCHCLFL